ncbi:MAG: MFS transporter [Deltaproteobacteria bacterium HGW-Deltaproteobacteria-10]|nr:MAG: MFS transporter [Deltaproteobacteria bacterium HGW-Deltaproteobacteria-10]
MNPNETLSGTINRFKLTFRALQYRNYRLFYLGQFISLVGTWMQQIAVSWLVYRITNSIFLLGLIGFISQFPTFVISPFAGVWSDRMNKHRILIWTQILSMIQALTLAALVLTDNITVWPIIILSFFIGCINAFDVPARQSFIIDMIEDRKDLGNAIALNSAMFNGTRFLGPFIAGILIAAVGEGICFLINGLSYIAVIAALLGMQIVYIKKETKNNGMLEELKEGFFYVFRDLKMKSILLLMALTSIMGIPFVVLMPAYAKDILKGGPQTLGFLMSSLGAGALLGAFYLASRINVKGLRKNIPLAVCVFGLGIIGLSLSHSLLISLLLVFLAGFGIMIQVASSNTWLQTNVDDDKRGRMISFFAVSFLGMAPFGSLLAGSVAGSLGVPLTLFAGGICCILGALFFHFRNHPPAGSL